jgi:hypothetical protein
MLAPDLFPSLSKARRTIRQQKIQLVRATSVGVGVGVATTTTTAAQQDQSSRQTETTQQLQQQLPCSSESCHTQNLETKYHPTTTRTTPFIGKSDTRVYPGDTIRILLQPPPSHGGRHERPPEDDHDNNGNELLTRKSTTTNSTTTQTTTTTTTTARGYPNLAYSKLPGILPRSSMKTTMWPLLINWRV